MQYFWLLISGGLYIYFTFQLKRNPEEAIHLLEYGLLTFFIFKALSYRIKDWSVYLTAILFVSLVGIADEFIQWLLPNRYWAFKDVGINTLASGIFILAVAKGIRPKIIYRPVQKYSVRMLIAITTIDLIILSLCLSNTPYVVNMYTTQFNGLSWLQNEEAMTQCGVIPLSLSSIWLVVAAILIFIWTFGKRWERRLES